LRDIDAERATLEVLTVELGKRLLSAFRGGHLDEAEAARLTTHAIDHDVDGENFTALGEPLSQQVLGGVKRKISNIETIRHSDSSWRRSEQKQASSGRTGGEVAFALVENEGRM
jgi:hypothetical protein